MVIVQSILFALVFAISIFFFTKKIKEVMRNIHLGRDLPRNDQPQKRLMTMLKVAFGQSKMGARPVAAFFHLLIYIGFVIINIEVIEIIIDGLFGTHRVLSFLGGFYNFLIASFEWLAIGVLLACVVFLMRRNVLRIKRFWMREMTAWPRSDANIILVTEILLMSAFLLMNASDLQLQLLKADHYFNPNGQVGAFPISSLLLPIISSFDVSSLMVIERFTWWFHILGILAFLNYVPYSKHFHILLAFPNTYYSNIDAKGKFNNMTNVTNEVKLMFDPNAVVEPTPVARFGAKDVRDLSWKQLMDAYSCTECGRCSAACPANLTGKLLSPRKIMMDTRDRLEEVGNGINKNGNDFVDEKSLLYDYITPEELMACTTCNACTVACPVNIDPLSIILDLRRFMVMEESKAPTEWNGMFTKIENNGAPWQFSPSDRMQWTEE